MTVISLYPTRDYYSAKEAAKFSITVGELIQNLECYDKDCKVIFNNDGGYTYGIVGPSSSRESYL